MKLLRYGPVDNERSGLLDRDGRIRDLSGHVLPVGHEPRDAVVNRTEFAISPTITLELASRL